MHLDVNVLAGLDPDGSFAVELSVSHPRMYLSRRQATDLAMRLIREAGGMQAVTASLYEVRRALADLHGQLHRGELTSQGEAVMLALRMEQRRLEMLLADTELPGD